MSEEGGRAAVFGLWPYSALVPVSAIPYAYPLARSIRVKASVFRMTAIRVNCIGSCPLCKICRGSHNEVEKFEGPMTAISARLAASRLHYAWVIIALTFIVSWSLVACGRARAC